MRRFSRTWLLLIAAIVAAVAAVGIASGSEDSAGTSAPLAESDCPRDPESLLPPGQETGGVTREEAEAYWRAYECGYEPPAGSGAMAPPPPVGEGD